MGFLDFFKTKKLVTKSTWQELGAVNSLFSNFGANTYKSDIVRSCVRPLAEFTSKAEIKCSKKDIERLLNNRPNIYMNGRDFLQKVRIRYEIYNNCFIYIQHDDTGKVTGFYPVPYSFFNAVEYNNELFIEFHFIDGRQVTLAWADLAVVRKDYNQSDISGDSNDAILNMLQLINTANEGTANAIKATANLRGILKSSKSMLSPEDRKRQKDEFVNDYLTISNKGGIAAIDGTQEFTPINMNPTTANAEQIKEYRQQVYSYFNVNDKIVQGAMTSDEIVAFYEMRIEPFLVALSTELQSKIFTQRELAQGNFVVYEANKLQFASLSMKIQMYKEVVLNGGMLRDDWLAACNMPPLPNGEGQKLIMRLDVAHVDSKEGENEDER